MNNINDSEVNDILKNIKEKESIEQVKDLIKDNKIEFFHDGSMYRIRLLNTKEKEELSELRSKRFIKMMQDKDILLEKDLKKMLKENRELDVDKMEIDINKKRIQEIELEYRLGEAISKNENEEILKTYKDQIEECREIRNILSTQKHLLLEHSLENQMLSYIAEVITYLSLDVETDGKWERKFKTLEEFQTHEDNALIDTAGLYSMVLQYV